jgi:K+-transporting ATPase ATPase C chain
MAQQLRAAVASLAIFTLLTGVAYPLVVTGIAQILFPRQANGSIIVRHGQAVGSELIGQPFSEARYFWGRPSATSPDPYDAGASAGSNLGPLSPALAERARDRVGALRAADPSQRGPVPADLVTTSASGLDPHISPAAAGYQVARVAKARGMSGDEVRAIVAACTEGRQFGLFGEPRVNVLKANLALDEVQGAARMKHER